MNVQQQTKRLIAYQYHLKGLNFAEIGKLIDISPRTVERYSQQDHWKAKANPKALSMRILELSKQGFKASTIARTIGMSRGTVYYHLKALERKESAK